MDATCIQTQPYHALIPCAYQHVSFELSSKDQNGLNSARKHAGGVFKIDSRLQ